MKRLFLSVAILTTAIALAQPPDNSKINKRDTAEGALTAGRQSNKKADLELARKIRQEVTDNKTMSTYAKNVKIITRDGQATLRGPVNSTEEKQAIEMIAKRLAGDSKVHNLLEIAPPK